MRMLHGSIAEKVGIADLLAPEAGAICKASGGEPALLPSTSLLDLAGRKLGLFFVGRRLASACGARRGLSLPGLSLFRPFP